ncbi:hypothetical protein B0T16DRAFT_335554 [Cercophora newfieldiana]|uniref:Uncharacterized protein n=1 Tax=Cercophora newfieldiana TaxID=92897 RepID=A0AA40CKG3_9PEZI|nr:hypothetical protein B0T16DRAFT_335554 [Cercophora newfieldiana]
MREAAGQQALERGDFGLYLWRFNVNIQQYIHIYTTWFWCSPPPPPEISDVEKNSRQKTYNTRDSLVVTDPTTSLALTGLSMGERTGSRVLQ